MLKKIVSGVSHVFIYYRGIVRCLCTINSIRNRFLLRFRHVGVEKKMAVTGVEAVHEKARSVRPFFIWNEHPPPPLLAS